ncbi:PilZ domain-containing protein [Bdellovibrio bacteriovorus]|uniref:PilZ domain-containing protein n=1 Tax=Bdellovibrio bacteriovorus TaxID=959 RepID=UPI0035A59B35
MKTKPWSLIILALLHILAPVGNLVLNALRSGRTLGQQWTYWFEILPKPLLLIYLVIPVLAGIFIYVCKRWSYWAYLGCLVVVLASNIYSYMTNMNLNTLLLLIVVVVVDLLVVAYFVVPSVQKVYFDPRTRWWEAAPRYHFNHMGAVNGEKAFVKSISQGGLLLSSAPAMNENDDVVVAWDFQGQHVEVKGKVVYKLQHGEIPQYGVRFDHGEESDRQVKELILRLHNEGLIVTERLPGPEDGFGMWLKKLVTRGEGLFPKMRT